MCVVVWCVGCGPENGLQNDIKPPCSVAKLLTHKRDVL